MEISGLDLARGVSVGTANAERAPRAKIAPVAIGIFICAVFPALFWCGALWWVSHAAGAPLSLATLATIGGVISAFLTVIGSAVMSGS